MAIPSVYINLEDDVSKIIERLRHNTAQQIVLVCPKKCHLFNDNANLLDLKQRIDLLGKELFIFTMDERGQEYAQSAGFRLKSLPKVSGSPALSDIKISQKAPANLPIIQQVPVIKEQPSVLSGAVSGIKNIANKFTAAPKIEVQKEEPEEQNYTEEKEEEYIPPQKVTVTETVFPNMEEEKPQEVKEESKGSLSKIITGITAISLVIILLLFFVVLPKATVVVYPKTEPVTRDMEINMSASATAPDAEKLIIPAVKIDESATVSDAFDSQGKQQVGNKSTGTVKIYNFTRLPLNLKTGTTILTLGSKTYNLVSDLVALKPTVYKNAKTKEVDESSLGDSVNIIASQGGEDYNLPAGTRVEITNQVFGSKPQVLFAKTDSEISGGTTRYLSMITQDDAVAAQSQLKNEALQQIKDKLKAGGLVLAEGAYTLQVVQFSTDNAVGSQTPSFHGTLVAKLSGLAFKQSDLNSLVSKRIGQTLALNKTLQPSQPDPTIVGVKNLDLNNQLAVLGVHYEGQAIYNVDLPDVSRQLVGKTQVQANEILRSQAEIDRIDITLAPVWQKNLPYFANKIKVSIANPISPQQ